MATKPTEIGLWALNEVTETVNDTTFVNKLQPPQGFIDNGVLALEPWSRAFLNYQLWVAGQWREWVDQALYPVGYILTVKDGVITDPATELGVGTWDDLGTNTVGTTTIRYWERTA